MSTASTTGTLVAGRYLAGDRIPEEPSVRLARDLVRSGSDVELALLPVASGEWRSLAARLRHVARFRHAALAPVIDFGLLDGAQTCFLAAEPRGSTRLADALRAGTPPLEQLLADALGLAARLAARGLPPVSLDPEQIRSSGALLRIPPLSLVRPQKAPPAGAGALAQACLDAATGAPAKLLRLLDAWSHGPGPDAATALARLEELHIFPPPRRVEPPLVGREVETQRLEKALNDLLEAGRGRVVAVTGAPGSGKTRLVREFRWAARAAGLTVIEAGGSHLGLGSSLPSVARQLVRQAPAAVLWRYASELATLCPELGSPPENPLRATHDPETRHHYLLDGVTRLVCEVALIRPIVILLHDLHAAERASIDLLRPIAVEIARHPGQVPCLLVLESRDSAPSESPLETLLRDLRRAPDFEELMLKGLSVEDIRQVLAELAGPERATSSRLRSLFTATGGNPAQVVASVRALAGDPGSPAPDAEHLSAREQRTALALLFLGRPADAEVLGRVAGTPVRRILPTLTRARVVQPSGSVPGAWELASKTAAAAPLTGLSSEEIVALRARALEERLVDGTSPRELMVLLESTGYPALGRDALLEAARLRHVAGAERDALSLLQAGLAHWHAPTDRPALLRPAAELAVACGEAATALGWLEELEAVEEGRNPLTTLERSKILAERGEPGAALAVLRRLGSSLAGDSPLAGRVATLEARARQRLGGVDEARDEARRALAIIPPGADAALDRAEAWSVLSSVEKTAGNLDLALEHARTALQEMGQDAPVKDRVRCLTRLATLHYVRGDLERAVSRFREALSASEERGYKPGVAALLGNLGVLLFNLGDREGARAHLERALELLERVGDARRTAVTLSNLGLLEATEGRVAAARERLRQAREAAEPLEDPACLSQVEMALGRLECGHAPRRAVRHLERALKLQEGLSELRLETITRALLGEALALTGKTQEGRREAQRALDVARHLGVADLEGLALRSLATAAAQAPQPGAPSAASLLEESVAAFRRASNTYEVEVSSRRLAEVEASEVRARSASPSQPAPGTPLPLETAISAASLSSGDGRADRRNLRILAEALWEERDAGPDRNLARLVEASRARFGAILTGPPEGKLDAGPPPPEQTLARAGDPPTDAIRHVLDAAPAARDPLAPDFWQLPFRSGLRLLCHPVPSLTGQTGPAALVMLGLDADTPAPPLGILRALARRLGHGLAPPPAQQPSAVARPVLLTGTDGFGPVLGRTPVMRRMFSLLERVAANELPVLLQGESGTGKGLVAKAIHDASPRAHAPFVPIDCAAIPESLIESELFGHRKGAFTGTVSDRRGLFEEASAGTIFLDEVTNIPAAVQAKLLRVIQEREVRRVGDTQVRPIDVRVIAATNQALEPLVSQGLFREDLYFRLRVIEVVLPPLRERLEDVPLLVERLLGQLASPPPSVERAALERLLAYPWPGNVRELDNELRRAYTLARGPLIRQTDLSPRILLPPHPPVAPSELPRLRDAVATTEKELLRRALELTGYHRARTAQLLGLSHQGLLNKIRKYRIRTPRRKTLN